MPKQDKLTSMLRVSYHSLLAQLLAEKVDKALHIPEMLAILGAKKFYEFMYVFGGRKISLPSVKDFARYDKLLQIWMYVLHNSRARKSTEQQLAAEHFQIPIEEVQEACALCEKHARRLIDMVTEFNKERDK